MSSVTRIFAQRSSVLRTLTRRQAVCARPAYISPSIRRGLLSSVGFTAVGLAFLVSNAPKTDSAAHGPKSADAAIEAHEEKEKGHDEKEDKEKSSGSDEQQKEEEGGEKGEGEGEEKENKSEGDDAPKGGASDPSSPDKASQSGQNVPPPSGDNSDLASKWDEKKQDQEESKKATRAGETKAATSSSETPSKKTQAEDPREDPQKGEGEAVQKGGSKD
ncbi:hypothetical protein F4679DRAFT_587325 [Xylaria curta]|nr:hypothetical protein F4679DRAFT_587325 [Xylaria curta]